MFLAGLVFVFGSTANAQSHKKIGMTKARAIAVTKADGGKLKASELEKEGGKWIYSFEFSNKKGTITEVNVEAYTGEVISVEDEDPAKEAKEAREEKAEKKKKN